MPTVVEALFEDLRAILLKPDQAAGIFPSAKVRWRPARTGGGPGGHSWLRYLQCHVFARPDFATGGPHGGAPRGGLDGGGAPHFAMGGTASRRRALTEPRCASERGLAMGGGRPAGAASRWEAAANPWLGAIARCSRTGSSNPSLSTGESLRTPVPTSKRPAFKGEDKSPTPFIMPERVRRPVPTPAEDQSDILPLPFVPTIGLQSKAYSSRNNATLRISPSPAGPSRTLPGPIIARIEGSDPRDSRSNHRRRPIVPPVSPIIPCQIV